MRGSRCPLCAVGSLRFQFLWSGYRTHRCSACGVEAVSPQPSAARLAEFYDNISGKKVVRWERRLAAVRRAFDGYLAEYERLTAAAPSSLLDVGGGVGYYSRAAQDRGLDACLVDWAFDAAGFARRTLGVRKVVQGDVQHCGSLFPDAMFDYVLARHVIEHLPEPTLFVEQLRGSLSDGGLLQVETPDITSWEQWGHPAVMAVNFRTLRRDNPDMSLTTAIGWSLRKGMSGVNPPKHLWGFTPRGLVGLLRRSGFEVLAWRRAEAGSKIFDPLYYDLAQPSRFAALGLAYRIWERLSSLAFRGRGMNLVAWARKVQPSARTEQSPPVAGRLAERPAKNEQRKHRQRGEVPGQQVGLDQRPAGHLEGQHAWDQGRRQGDGEPPGEGPARAA